MESSAKQGKIEGGSRSAEWKTTGGISSGRGKPFARDLTSGRKRGPSIEVREGGLGQATEARIIRG